VFKKPSILPLLKTFDPVKEPFKGRDDRLFTGPCSRLFTGLCMFPYRICRGPCMLSCRRYREPCRQYQESPACCQPSPIYCRLFHFHLFNFLSFVRSFSHFLFSRHRINVGPDPYLTKRAVEPFIFCFALYVPCRICRGPCMLSCRLYRELCRLSREPCMLTTKPYLLSSISFSFFLFTVVYFDSAGPVCSLVVHPESPACYPVAYIESRVVYQGSPAC